MHLAPSLVALGAGAVAFGLWGLLRCRRARRLAQVLPALLEGVALHELLLDAAGRVVDFRLLEANPAWLDHLGLAGPVRGRTGAELFGEARLPFLERLGAVVRTGEPCSFAFTSLRSGRGLQVTAVRVGAGRFATVVEDATERRRVQEALESSRAELAQALDLASMATWRYDAATARFCFDDRFYRLCGSSLALEGSPFMDVASYSQAFLPREERDLVAQEVTAALASTDPAYSRQVEHHLLRRDGERRHVVVRFTLVRDGEGRPAAILGANQDITERKRAEERLLQAHKAEGLTLMAAGIAHDFNNQFQTLMSSLEVARQDLPSDGRPGRALARAREALDGAAALAHRMLDFTGKGFRRAETLDLVRALEGLSAELRRALEAFPGARLRLELPEGAATVQVDPDKLRQVVLALLENAGESLEGRGGEVRLRVHPAPMEASAFSGFLWLEGAPSSPCWMLEVADAGCGMDPETLGRIGDPFFSTKAAGRGLGLPAALGILKAHQAGLGVWSAPGQGTQLLVALPCGAAETQGPAPALSPASGGRLVLLADDEEDLREVVAEVLRELLGYEVLEARDGVEALECFHAKGDEIALVLLDAQMPRMGGVEAFQAMKALRPGVKALLCSGYSADFGQSTVQTHGFLGFLKKPFSIEELKRALVQALEG